MPIDYKKELESAAKSMILVHDPNLLIKMIARMIVHKVRVNHAGILLHDINLNTYVLTVSYGATGVKIPQGFARMDSDNTLVNFFQRRMDKLVLDSPALVYDDISKLIGKPSLDPKTKKNLKSMLYQMEIFDTQVCIPSYFRNELLGLLLLGKKQDRRKFSSHELDFFIALASDVAMAIRNASLFKDLESELERNKRLFINTTVALATAIDAKDHYTHGHTARVTDLSLKIAEKFSRTNKKEATKNFIENLHIASLLHDIGKIGIPEAILNKASALTENEWKRMQEHPTVGVTILQPIKELNEAILGVKYHHERYDGTGYPEGLKAEQIPLIASIISIADAFDAMTTDRPYRKGLLIDEAVREIERKSGTQFNPKIVKLLIELYKEDKL